MNSLQDLHPREIWHYFYEITQVPRPSGKEEKIRAYLLDFAERHQLEFRQDQTGNVLIKKQATYDKQDSATIILQSHIDMVCEKNSDTIFDFENDALNVFVEDGWVKARGTTLGGDDGIGMAAQLALLASSNISHPTLECLFTVEEETGLTGAFGLEAGFLSGKILLNLDSEDDAEVYVGCAGGIDTLVELDYLLEKSPIGYEAVKVKVSGLNGGHSGCDIHLGRANANLVLADFITHIYSKFDIRIADFQGGNLRNAIPREANAVVLIPAVQEMDFLTELNVYFEEKKIEYIHTEPNLQITSEAIEVPSTVLCIQSQINLLRVICNCPNGVVKMSEVIEGLVETSTNLASIKVKPKGIIEIVTSQRSSSEREKNKIASHIKDHFESQGARVCHSDGYPGWAPSMDSVILKITKQAFYDLYSEYPQVKAIHAGLECGLFLEKYPDLDMVSIGPTIKDAHSPDERLEISAVERFWEWLLEILKQV